MESKPFVEVLSHPWPMVLVPWSSGVIYSVQAGGIGCYHFDVEAICLPLQNGEWVRKKLMALHPGCARTISSEEADLMDEILHDSQGDPLMTVDRDRLSESYEAWVYVTICAHWDEMLRGFRGRSAILTWENCD